MEKRNYGIDLLRLVLMYMVCVLHVLGQGGILGSYQAGTPAYGVFWLMEICAYCAVDGFALISGYMAADKPARYSKLIEMWFQVFFYSFVLTAVLACAGLCKGVSAGSMLRNALPVTSKAYWYFTAYFAASFFTPMINRFVSQIGESTARKFLLVFFVLFSVLEHYSEPFKTQGGYSAVWLIVLYFIGALSKKGSLFQKKKNGFLLLLWLACIGITWAALILFGKTKLISFVSPTVLLAGLAMVVRFSRISIPGKVIRRLSPLAFGVYLFQLNNVIWQKLDGAAITRLTRHLPVAFLEIILFAALLFAAGMAVEFVRTLLHRALKISKLSEKIEKAIRKGIDRLLPLLR